MTTTLAQIVAISTGVVAGATRAFTDLHREVQRDELVTGFAKVYQPFAEDEREELPGESKHVQVNVVDAIAEVRRVLTRLYDVTATKDRTNCDARADIAVDGQTLATDVPATYLLWLEKRLVDLHTFIAKLPVLDPAERWSWDVPAGLWVSEPAQTVRTRKEPRTLVQWEPPSPEFKQPPQTSVYTVDLPAGRWTTTKFSGALPPQARADMLARLTKLVEAVRFARERANTTPVVDMRVGEQLLGYVLG